MVRGFSLNKILGLKGVGGFSLNRALGITKALHQIGKVTGIPLTKSGRQRKIGGSFWKW